MTRFLKRILLLFFAITSLAARAQTPVDSLRAVIQAAPGAESIESYIKLGLYYREVNPDSSTYYARKILELAGKNLSHRAEGHGILSAVLQFQGDLNNALTEANRAVKLYEEAGDSSGLAAAIANVGSIYYLKADYSLAVKYLMRSLKMKEAQGHKKGVASIRLNIGNLYLVQKKYDLARSHYKRALAAFEEVNSPKGISYCHNNLGVIAEALGQYEEALDEYLQGYKIDEQEEDKFGMAAAFFNIAEVYRKTNRKSLAKESYQKTLELSRAINDQVKMGTSLINLAEFELEAGRKESAYRMGSEALEIARRTGMKPLLSRTLEGMTKITAGLGKYQDAYLLSQELLELRYEIAEEIKNEELNSIQSQYEADRKNQEILLLQKDKSLQDATLKRQKLVNKVYAGAIFVFILLLFFIVNRYQLIRKNEQLLQRMNASLENKVHERTKALQDALERAEKADKLKTFFLSNLNHELRTPMNGIIGMASYLQENMTDPDKKQLAKSLLDNSQRLSDTLSAVIELSGLEASGELLQWQPTDVIQVAREAIIRHENEAKIKGLQLDFVHFADEVVIPADAKVLGRILDSLLHNAIKFTDNGNILLEISRQQQADHQFIDIRVRDTGLGIAKANLEHIFEAFRKGDEVLYRGYEGLGIGLTLARKYTQLLDGHLSVDSEPGRGTQFTVRLHQQPA